MRSFFRYLPDDPAAARWGIRLHAAGHTRYAPGQAYPQAGHPADHADLDRGRILAAWQLVWISAGRGWLQTEATGELPVAAGMLVVLVPGVRHRYAPAAATGWTEWWLELDGSLIEAAALSPERPVLELGGDVVVAEAMTRAVTLVGEQPPGFRAEAGAWAHVVLARLGALAPMAPAHPGVRRVVQAVQSEPQRPWTVAGLARLAGLSPARFRACFHAHAGCSPQAYLIDLRLARLRAYLADPQRPVAEAAAMAGFADPFYASRLFRSRHGASPQAWRRR